MFNSSVISVLFPIVFFLVAALIIAIIVVALIKSIRRSAKNQNYSILTADCRIISKRTQAVNEKDGSTSEKQYATFEVQAGVNMELEISCGEYDLIAEGDEGKVTFQGDRFVSFMKRMD